MARINWGPMEQRVTALILDPNHTYRTAAAQLSKEFGVEIGEKPLELKARRMGLTKVMASPVPRFILPDAGEQLDDQGLWEHAKQVTARDVRRHEQQRLVTVELDDPRPIAVAVISDQHIALRGPVRLDRMEEDARLIASTPGLYGILGGDGVDNHIKHRAALVGSGSRPEDEWRLYNHYLSLFDAGGHSKLLALISGNHDDWTRDETGVDLVARLARSNRVHYAPDELMLALRLRQVEYRIKVRHQYGMNSRFNLTHTVKRMWEHGQDQFDIGVVCHHHEAAIEPFMKHGQRIWAARPGSYQLTSGHARRYGHNHSIPTCPTFILHPTRHYIQGFWDVRDAADYLTYMRDRWNV